MCVCVWERVCVCVGVWVWERVCVCVTESKFLCGCVWVCLGVCVTESKFLCVFVSRFGCMFSKLACKIYAFRVYNEFQGAIYALVLSLFYAQKHWIEEQCFVRRVELVQLCFRFISTLTVFLLVMLLSIKSYCDKLH